MKKVTCIAIYSYVNNCYDLTNITVKHKHENITIYDENRKDFYRENVYKYNSFNELYNSVLAFLKFNNFYVHSWKMFDRKWYDIDFININDFSINRYSLC